MPADAGKTLAEQIASAVNVGNDVSQAHSAAVLPVRYARVLWQSVPGINREAALGGCAAYRRCPSLRYEKTRTRPGRGSAPRARWKPSGGRARTGRFRPGVLQCRGRLAARGIESNAGYRTMFRAWGLQHPTPRQPTGLGTVNAVRRFPAPSV